MLDPSIEAEVFQESRVRAFQLLNLRGEILNLPFKGGRHLFCV